jgi:hypothetical protein
MAQTTCLASFGPVFVAAAHPKPPIGPRDAHRHRSPAAASVAAAAAPRGVGGGPYSCYTCRGGGGPSLWLV